MKNSLTTREVKTRVILWSIGILLMFFCMDFGIRKIMYTHRDYQIDTDNDYIYLYDGGRFIGNVQWDGGKLDSLILNDNQ